MMPLGCTCVAAVTGAKPRTCRRLIRLHQAPCIRSCKLSQPGRAATSCGDRAVGADAAASSEKTTTSPQVAIDSPTSLRAFMQALQGKADSLRALAASFAPQAAAADAETLEKVQHAVKRLHAFVSIGHDLSETYVRRLGRSIHDTQAQRALASHIVRIDVLASSVTAMKRSFECGGIEMGDQLNALLASVKALRVTATKAEQEAQFLQDNPEAAAAVQEAEFPISPPEQWSNGHSEPGADENAPTAENGHTLEPAPTDTSETEAPTDTSETEARTDEEGSGREVSGEESDSSVGVYSQVGGEDDEEEEDLNSIEGLHSSIQRQRNRLQNLMGRVESLQHLAANLESQEDGKNDHNIETLRNAIVELAKLRQMVESDDAALQSHDAALGAASVLATTGDAVSVDTAPRAPVSTSALRRQQAQQLDGQDSSEWDSALDGYESEASAGAEEARAWVDEKAPPQISPRATVRKVPPVGVIGEMPEAEVAGEAGPAQSGGDAVAGGVVQPSLDASRPGRSFVQRRRRTADTYASRRSRSQEENQRPRHQDEVREISERVMLQAEELRQELSERRAHMDGRNPPPPRSREEVWAASRRRRPTGDYMSRRTSEVAAREKAGAIRRRSSSARLAPPRQQAPTVFASSGWSDQRATERSRSELSSADGTAAGPDKAWQMFESDTRQPEVQAGSSGDGDAPGAQPFVQMRRRSSYDARRQGGDEENQRRRGSIDFSQGRHQRTGHKDASTSSLWGSDTTSTPADVDERAAQGNGSAAEAARVEAGAGPGAEHDSPGSELKGAAKQFFGGGESDSSRPFVLRKKGRPPADARRSARSQEENDRRKRKLASESSAGADSLRNSSGSEQVPASRDYSLPSAGPESVSRGTGSDTPELGGVARGGEAGVPFVHKQRSVDYAARRSGGSNSGATRRASKSVPRADGSSSADLRDREPPVDARGGDSFGGEVPHRRSKAGQPASQPYVHRRRSSQDAYSARRSDTAQNGDARRRRSSRTSRHAPVQPRSAANQPAPSDISKATGEYSWDARGADSREADAAGSASFGSSEAGSAYSGGTDWSQQQPESRSPPFVQKKKVAPNYAARRSSGAARGGDSGRRRQSRDSRDVPARSSAPAPHSEESQYTARKVPPSERVPELPEQPEPAPSFFDASPTPAPEPVLDSASDASSGSWDAWGSSAGQNAGGSGSGDNEPQGAGAPFVRRKQPDYAARRSSRTGDRDHQRRRSRSHTAKPSQPQEHAPHAEQESFSGNGKVKDNSESAPRSTPLVHKKKQVDYSARRSGGGNGERGDRAARSARKAPRSHPVSTPTGLNSQPKTPESHEHRSWDSSSAEREQPQHGAGAHPSDDNHHSGGARSSLVGSRDSGVRRCGGSRSRGVDGPRGAARYGLGGGAVEGAERERRRSMSGGIGASRYMNGSGRVAEQNGAAGNGGGPHVRRVESAGADRYSSRRGRGDEENARRGLRRYQ